MPRPPLPRSSLRALTRGDRVVPLYHQVQHLVRSRIERGEYPQGSQIPSEHELCRELDVSRVTVREALRELVRDRLLVKVQGKGTFVAERLGRDMPPLKFTGFLEDIYDRVRRLDVKFVAIDRVPLGEDMRTLLQLSADETELVRIRRTRYVNDGPFSYTVNYLPCAIGDRIDESSLHLRPLLEILQDDLQIPIVRAHEVVEAASADPDVAAQLEIPVMFPVMHVRRTMYTESDRAFELVETFYRADKYQYSVDLMRVRQDGKWRWSQRSGR